MRLILSFILIVNLSSCSSIISHTKHGFGHSYAGFQNSVTMAPCNLAISGTILFLPAPFIIADMPLSLLSDTLILPWDLYYDSNKKREDVTYSVSEYCDEVMEGMKSSHDKKVPNEQPKHDKKINKDT